VRGLRDRVQLSRKGGATVESKRKRKKITKKLCEKALNSLLGQNKKNEIDIWASF
jgi:hypothetical protein